MCAFAVCIFINNIRAIQEQEREKWKGKRKKEKED